MRWPKLEDDGQGDEPSRADVPLHLLAEFSSASLDRWQPVILDEERRCFSLHWPKAIPEGLSRSYFQRLLDVAPWVELRNTKGTSVTRSTCWYATGGCTCDYTYGQQTRVTNASTLQPAAEGVEKVEPSENTQFIHGSVEVEPLSEGSLSSFRSVMEEILEYVFGKLFPGLSREAWPNSANLNLYRDGWQGVGWHADDELLFKGKDSDCPVVSISLGAAREFWIALKDGTAGDPPRRSGVPVSDSIVELDLEDGDVLTMEGRLQRHCLHFVPKCNPREPLRDERINITFRWVREHRYRCPLRWRHAETMDRTLSAIIGTLDSQDQDRRLLPLSLQFHGGAYARDWSQQVCPGVLNPEQQLRLCDGCKHVCYAEGRPCCEGVGDWAEHWFCRRCWFHWEPEAFSEPPSLEAWCVPNYSENWERWETIGPYDTGVLEALEPIMQPEPIWNMRPAFALWCGAWEQLQLLGEIQNDAQLLKLETPSTLPSGEGLALFAAGTYPAREYIVEGGRWMIAVNKEGLDEVWLAMCQGLLQGLFDGQAGACGIAATLSTRSPSRDGKLAVWLLKAQDDLHVLAVGSVFMDLLRAKGFVGRLKFENFQRGKVTLSLRP